MDDHTMLSNINTALGKALYSAEVERFRLEVNKKLPLVRLITNNANGVTTTREILGPGLTETVRSNLKCMSTHDRDENICQYLAKGLTQQEVADKMGVSQSLVSKVYRSRRR
jgi:DNA-binding NarL/FixJ family response regulator